MVAIGSGWNLGHNKDVWASASTNKKLKRLPSSLNEQFEHCFWHTQRRVNKLGVTIAWIESYPVYAYQPTDWVNYFTKVSLNSSNFNASELDPQMHPHLEKLLVDPQYRNLSADWESKYIIDDNTMADLTQAILKTYPWREILLIVMMTVVFPLCVVVLVVSLSCVGKKKMCRGKHQY